MDISLPKADAAEGRILCLFPDGHRTVFAEKLYAVFGLQYLEGKLYVLHNPKFSVFDDDKAWGAIAGELIDQTLPDPSALNWNDHVPGQFPPRHGWLFLRGVRGQRIARRDGHRRFASRLVYAVAFFAFGPMAPSSKWWRTACATSSMWP